VKLDKECHPILNDTVELRDKAVEFFQVECPGLKPSGYAIVAEREDVESRLKSFQQRNTQRMREGEQLNVIILGMDATSRMNFERSVFESTKALLMLLIFN
jgi:hypothetical protein